jgi:hypothetical protein
MTMNRVLSIAILVAGVVIFVFGLNTQDAFASRASGALTGTPIDKGIWLIVLGLVGIIVGGLSSMFRRSGH